MTKVTQPARIARTPLTRYQKGLFALLGVATLFDGYELFALPQVLPSLRAEFALDQRGVGLLVGCVGVGSLVAFALIRHADIVGRRRVLLISTVGYALASVVTALTQDAYQFGVAQLVSRTFLYTEYAVCMVYCAEEFPADRRGHVVGLMQVFHLVGTLSCAGLVPLMLKTTWGWRLVYVAGAVPLLLIFWLQRGVRETRRFLELKRTPRRYDLFAIFRTEYSGRVMLLAVVWGLTYLCT